MTDYDLGKARGRIVIDHDERGFRRAEGANDRLAESAHRVAEGFVDAEKAQEDYDKQLQKTQKSEESFKRNQSEVQKAQNRLNEAQSIANRLKDEGKTKTERYKQAVDNAQKAQNRYNEAVAESSRAEAKFNAELGKVQKSYRTLQNALADSRSNKVNIDTDSAMQKIRSLRKEHELFLKSLSLTGSVAGGGAKVGGMASGGLALGGLAGLAAGGATGYGVNGIMASIQAIGQLSGVAGLLPVVFGNLATTIGTITIASQGMGDAFSAVAANDAKAFGEALKKLSTNGQEVAIAFNELYPALEDFRKLVQDNFFKGIADEMRQLSATYMPILKDSFAGFANILNGTLRDLAAWAKQTGVVDDFRKIMDNLSLTMGTLAPTARMLADIFLDIMKVSSDFGPSLAASFQTMVKEFRDFIDTARADGSLAQWIQTGIDSFKSLMRSFKEFGSAFGTIFEIQNKYSGGFFGFIERMATAFNDWTKSVEGNAALNEFFRSITEMSKALTPVLGSLANIIVGQIIPMFADLGTAIQPGILAFLKGFSESLKILSPYIQQLSGPLNDLLAALGDSLVQVVQELGPALPEMFRSFVDAIIQLLPQLPAMAKAIVEIGETFMKYLPGIIDDINQAAPVLLWLLKAAMDLAIGLSAAATQIAVWLGKMIAGIGEFLTKLLYEWPQQAGDAMREFFAQMDIGADVEIVLGWFGDFFKNLGTTISNGWSSLLENLNGLKDKLWDWLKELPGKAFDAGKAIVDDLMEGMVERLGPLGKVAKEIVDAVSEWLPQSPAKKGPFSGKGWSRTRGEKLATDFAEGIGAGSNEAQYAGGTLSKATESGIGQFVSDMLEFSRFGQNISSLFQSIANNIFDIADIVTTNPLTGESTMPKKWRRTATDEELRRLNEDKAFKERLDAEKKAKDEAEKKAREEAGRLRPERVSPSPAGAPEIPTGDPNLPNQTVPLRPPPGGMRNLLNQPAPGAAVNPGGYMGDEALLANVPSGRYVVAAEYMNGRGRNGESAREIGDLTQGLGDCTSSIEDLVAMMDGNPTGNRSMSTNNAATWAAENGFLPTDTPMPGTFQIGWNASHMQATLPGGTNWNWGGDDSAAAGGRSGGGAWDPNFNFTQHYYRPVGGMRTVAPRTPAPDPTPPLSDGKKANRMIDPNAHEGTGAYPGTKTADEFIRMSESLDSIDRATKDQLSQQDIMINELRARDPMLDAAINAAKDPNSTDEQVGTALDKISEIADQQRHLDTAQSRYMADGLDSMTSTLGGARGMSQLQQDPFQMAQQVVSGAFGLIGDGFKIFDSTMKSIDSAASIADTLVRGISNTNDVYQIVDELQSFIELAGNISQAISDGLALAGTIATVAGGGQDGGATGAALQAISAIFGVATSVIQTVNAAVDLAQEAYKLGSKYVGKALSYIVGGGNGSLMGDIKFLLDQNTGELKTWSGDNPSDKRSFMAPSLMPFGEDPTSPQQGRIRDINMYIGPGTDPNEAMNAAMWSIKTDSNGVFTSTAY